jgi:hypothetical protein
MLKLKKILIVIEPDNENQPALEKCLDQIVAEEAGVEPTKPVINRLHRV